MNTPHKRLWNLFHEQHPHRPSDISDDPNLFGQLTYGKLCERFISLQMGGKLTTIQRNYTTLQHLSLSLNLQKNIVNFSNPLLSGVDNLTQPQVQPHRPPQYHRSTRRNNPGTRHNPRSRNYQSQPSSQLQQRLIRQDNLYTDRQNSAIIQNTNLQPLQRSEALHCCMDLDRQKHQYLLAGGLRGSVCVYDLEQNLDSGASEYPQMSCPIATIGDIGGRVSRIQWYPRDTGMFFASIYNGVLFVYDSNTLQVATGFRFSGRTEIFDFSLSPISQKHTQIAVVGSEPTVRLCDLRTAAVTHSLIGHTKSLGSVCWSPVEEFQVYSSSLDQTIRLWDIRKASSSLLIFSPAPPRLPSPQEDLDTSFPSPNKNFTISSPSSRNMSSPIHSRLSSISSPSSSPSLSPPSTPLFSSPSSFHSSPSRSSSSLSPRSLNQIPSRSQSLPLSSSSQPTFEEVCYGNTSSDLDIFEQPWQHTYDINNIGGGVTQISLSKTGRYLFSCSDREYITVWNPENSTPIMINYSSRSQGTHQLCNKTLSISDDEEFLFSGNGNYLDIIELETGKCRASLPGHLSNIVYCIYRPTTHEVYSISKDGKILVWSPTYPLKPPEQTVIFFSQIIIMIG